MRHEAGSLSGGAGSGYRPGVGRGVDSSGPDGAHHGVEPGPCTGDQAAVEQEEIRGVVDSLGSARRALLRADPADKLEVYRQLGLRLIYLPAERTMRADINIDAQSWGYGLCPRGTRPLRTRPSPAETTGGGVAVCVQIRELHANHMLGARHLRSRKRCYRHP